MIITLPSDDFFTDVYHKVMCFNEYFERGNDEVEAVLIIISKDQEKQVVAESNTVKFNARERGHGVPEGKNE